MLMEFRGFVVLTWLVEINRWYSWVNPMALSVEMKSGWFWLTCRADVDYFKAIAVGWTVKVLAEKWSCMEPLLVLKGWCWWLSCGAEADGWALELSLCCWLNCWVDVAVDLLSWCCWWNCSSEAVDWTVELMLLVDLLNWSCWIKCWVDAVGWTVQLMLLNELLN